jgi:hypothetical protein
VKCSNQITERYKFSLALTKLSIHKNIQETTAEDYERKADNKQWNVLLSNRKLIFDFQRRNAVVVFRLHI